MTRKAHPLGITESVICRACETPFLWRRDAAHRRKPHYCPDADCQRRRNNLRSALHLRKVRAVVKAYQARDGHTVPPPLAPPPPEPTPTVERLLAAAKARRLREEWATGRRRFTIQDGWQQRGDATSPFERTHGDGEGW